MGIRGQSAAEKSEKRVALAIDKDKGSQYAIKWVVDQFLTRGQALTLLHVTRTTNSAPNHTLPAAGGMVLISNVTNDSHTEEIFLPYRGFCSKKNIICNEVTIEDTDVPKALIKYVAANSTEILVLGSPSRSGIFKFRTTDVPSTVLKGAPDFCTVYVVGKGKLLHVRTATCTPRLKPPPSNQMQQQPCKVSGLNHRQSRESERTRYHHPSKLDDFEIKSPFTRGKAAMNKSYQLSPETDISYVCSDKPNMDNMYPSLYDGLESGITTRYSNTSEWDNRSSTSSSYSGTKFIDMSSAHSESTSASTESGKLCHSQNVDEKMEAEMRKLRLELKQTMDMYNTACKEVVTAKQKDMELNQWKLEEKKRLEEAQLAEEVALALVQREKAKSKAAIEAAEAAQRIAELESQKRRNAELKALKEAEERKKASEGRVCDISYRKYTLEEIESATADFSKSCKIGEGGYGPVYRGELDHTPVAIKVLRPDAAQGQSQLLQEVKVLSFMRHPNMVLLLGACPEYGCLVYEYMANGSLEDRLFQRGNTPVIPWQLRFRMAAEICTGLLFLHQTKPEPLVHRDLKPANILLDNNYVSKISDVGLARLVPPSVVDSVTQYHMTSAAGTFCYIDPEYQQTGMLGIKSDVYSLGVLLIQLITAKSPMGLTCHVEKAIEEGTFTEMLDPAVPDWPVGETLEFAKLALQCAKMRRKDRPDLGKVVLPELIRLRAFSEDSINSAMLDGGKEHLSRQDLISKRQDVISDPNLPHSENDCSRSRSSTSSYNEGR
uniref:U-box domain-containing protein 35-like isoform X2 n=1 Tax=Fragaria vesca subsp. vesca TaxID=101020 RepID=UPI0005C86C32|nr:PREDICTED: U-box domain-containing protein 35-like isoform X2 [Fragaria vesca subsp. vesca]